MFVGGESHVASVEQQGNPTIVKSRRSRCVLGRKDTEDGPLCVITPEESGWYRAYVNNFLLEEPDSFMAKKFRNRFRLPYPSYKELLHQISSDSRFERWCGHKWNGKKSSPVQLLLLGTLRYLGRGWMFDDIEEQTASVHHNFFHKFIEFGSTTLYSMHVIKPFHLAEAQSNMSEYAEAGFPGCVGSTDCTHITTERCEYNLKNNHLGGKSNQTARTFNLTCNHRRRILHTTRGGPARWNDMTMVRFDTFLTAVRAGNILSDNEFELLSYDKEGNVISVRYNGVYVIVDNGYLAWSCTVPPLSVTNKIDETRWSRWVESMRKDVECTFGILKGRWRILKTGVCVYGVDKVDEIWLTCCALHNWLLDIDGLSNKWNDGVLVSDWDGEMGRMDFDGLCESIPNSIARLSSNLDPRNYDISNMGPGEDVVGEIYHGDRGGEDEEDDDCMEHGQLMTPVNSMSLVYFRRQLVVHFSIMFARNLIKWPRNRSGKHVDRAKLFK